MAFVIKDRDLDKEIEKYQQYLIQVHGIKNVSKADVVRHLLQMRKQGKKTNIRWEKSFE